MYMYTVGGDRVESLAIARRFDGVTENAGFKVIVQCNLGLDFVTKQHKSLQKLQPVYSLV